jgi:hypothetical protein
MTDASGIALIAQNIARNLGWPVFPCSENKAPARPKYQGGNGFKDASTDPNVIADLWHFWPGTLIGIPTGEVSGIDVLDVDAKHDNATAWWTAARKNIPPTRVYQTRSGGLHACFLHAPAIGNTQSKLARGVDTRGNGGYIIFWYAVGFECLDHSPLVPWPKWLRKCVLWQSPKAFRPAAVTSPEHADKAIDGILRKVANAREGERNATLFWASCRLAERVNARQIGQSEATSLLIANATSIGLTEVEATRTVASALQVA